MSGRNVLKEVVEVVGGIVLGALLVVRDVPVVSGILRFVAGNPMACGLIIGGAVVVVVGDCLRRGGGRRYR